jgi:hypothetical protein
MKTKITIPSDYRCLVVEDSEVRNEWFAYKMPNCVIATNPLDALRELNEHEFDIVFLDHDCHGKFFVDPTDPEFLNRTFWRAAQKLHRDEFKGEIVIHSGNPVGAKRMFDLLKNKCHPFVAPFGSFDVRIKDE